MTIDPATETRWGFVRDENEYDEQEDEEPETEPKPKRTTREAREDSEAGETE